MNKNRRFRKRAIAIIIAADLIAVFAAYAGAFAVRSLTNLLIFQEPIPLMRWRQIQHYLPLLALTQVLFLYFFGLYDYSILLIKRRYLVNTAKAVSVQVLFMAAFRFFIQTEFPRSVFAVYWIIDIVGVVLIRSLIVSIWSRKQDRRKVLIVGTNDAARELLKEIERLPSYGLQVVGFVSEAEDWPTVRSFHGRPILGNRNQIVELARKHSIDEIIIAASNSWQEKLIDSITRLEQTPARISLIPSCYELMIGKVNQLRIYDIPLVEVVREPALDYQKVFKRLFDLCVASAVSILSLPLLPLIALLIKLTSRGPVLYRQTRVGVDKKTFDILKFRTMMPNAEKNTGPVLSDEKDERLTPVGGLLRKFRLDELPQLFNILKGDMSLVGPRPERPCFIEFNLKKIPGYSERFKVKPGLTGLAQVNGGYATSPENKLKYDLAYIYNQSLGLDLVILLETVRVIITGGKVESSMERNRR